MIRTLRCCLLAAFAAWRAFTQPPPGTDCPKGICKGSGVLLITDYGRTYEQPCICAPLTRRSHP